MQKFKIGVGNCSNIRWRCNICLFNIHQCHWEVPLGAIAHNRNILHSAYMKWHTRRSRDVKRTKQYFNLLFTIRHIKTAYGLIIHALNTLKIINVLSAYTYTHTQVHAYMYSYPFTPRITVLYSLLSSSPCKERIKLCKSFKIMYVLCFSVKTRNLLS